MLRRKPMSQVEVARGRVAELRRMLDNTAYSDSCKEGIKVEVDRWQQYLTRLENAQETA